jgi:hypothetical protein
MKPAKDRSVILGGPRDKGIEPTTRPEERAEGLRGVFDELSGLSARKAADQMNKRSMPTPKGGKWFATQVVDVRNRLVAQEFKPR